MSRKEVSLPKTVGVLQKPHRGLHVADVIRVFEITEFVHIRGLGVLWVVWMSTKSVADGCEANDT